MYIYRGGLLILVVRVLIYRAKRNRRVLICEHKQIQPNGMIQSFAAAAAAAAAVNT